MIDAEHIRAARLAVAESQAAFGERFGVDQSTIHRWETSGPPKQKLVQDGIRRALDQIGLAAMPSREADAQPTGVQS